MAGLLSAPAPPSPPPLLPIIDNSDAEETARRLAVLTRRRRGRAGAIATSARGTRSLLAAGTAAPNRKSLLGELGEQ